FPPPPSPPLFPYTTLFRSWTGNTVPPCHENRSQGDAADRRPPADPVRGGRGDRGRLRHPGVRDQPLQARGGRLLRQGLRTRAERSEEHTSELQSRENLVCR